MKRLKELGFISNGSRKVITQHLYDQQFTLCLQIPEMFKFDESV